MGIISHFNLIPENIKAITKPTPYDPESSTVRFRIHGYNPSDVFNMFQELERDLPKTILILNSTALLNVPDLYLATATI